MIGKILKVKDINMAFNKKEKRVSVFACFTHVKYSDNYIIFGDYNNYKNGILYCGSVYIKGDTLVIFDVKEDKMDIVIDFVNKVCSGTDDVEYEAINITNITDVEIVSKSDRNVGSDVLNKLDELTIPKDIVDISEEENKESLSFLYFMLVVNIFLLVGSIYVYFNKNMFFNNYDSVVCTLNGVEDIGYRYSDKIYLEFDKKRELRYLKHDISYQFNDKSEYNNFKYNNLWVEFKIDDYKFDDDKLVFSYVNSGKLIDNYELMTSYDEVLGYYKSNGYECLKEE